MCLHPKPRFQVDLDRGRGGGQNCTEKCASQIPQKEAHLQLPLRLRKVNASLYGHSVAFCSPAEK